MRPPFGVGRAGCSRLATMSAAKKARVDGRGLMCISVSEKSLATTLDAMEGAPPHGCLCWLDLAVIRCACVCVCPALAATTIHIGWLL